MFYSRSFIVLLFIFSSDSPEVEFCIRHGVRVNVHISHRFAPASFVDKTIFPHFTVVIPLPWIRWLYRFGSDQVCCSCHLSLYMYLLIFISAFIISYWEDRFQNIPSTMIIELVIFPFSSYSVWGSITKLVGFRTFIYSYWIDPSVIMNCYSLCLIICLVLMTDLVLVDLYLLLKISASF